MTRWRVWALRVIVVLALAGFGVGGFGLNRARNASIESRRELCAAVNQTRGAVRQLVDIAFGPALAKTTNPEQKAALLAYLKQVKAPVHDLPCGEIVHG